LLSLIKKDFIVLKRTMLFGIAYSVFVFFAFSNPVFSQFTYIMGAVATGYIFSLTAIQAEFKNNTDVIINSLPVTRREVVTARYISLFILTAAAVAIVAAVGLALKLTPLPFNIRFINLQDAAVSIALVAFLNAFLIPIFYLTSGRWLQLVNIALFMVIFFAPSTLYQFFIEHKGSPGMSFVIDFAVRSPWILPLLGTAILLLLLATSFLFSLRIYLKKGLLVTKVGWEYGNMSCMPVLSPAFFL